MRELTCIGCPIGCMLTVQIKEEKILVTGNTCPRGEKYAINEITCPKRMVTSTIELKGGRINRVSVKTESEIPKERIMDCMAEIRRAWVHAPVNIGDVVIENCAGTGVNVVITKNVAAANT